jgi:3-deoxy-manno-octulosonate cytidylyltransferase (CMP-KDO synthetase)
VGLQLIKMRVVAIIPARYKSTRLPGKPLIKLKGKEMIVRVAEIAEKALGKENVYVATDDQRIIDVVENYGFQSILTSEKCLTGTDRVAEASLQIEADMFINVQGDEPLLDPNDILKIKEAKTKYPDHIVNCWAPLNEYEEADNPKLAKIVSNLYGEMLYISRSAIPGTKNGGSECVMKNVSIYGFSKEHLKAFSLTDSKSPLESIEDIETLRFLELGYKIKLVEVKGDSYSVDYPEDIKIVEELL